MDDSKRSTLFLKNSSAHMPPRRQQLAVNSPDLDNSESGENQYQLAMTEALARHEQELMRVGQLRKLQAQDFKQQIAIQEEIVAAERDQDAFKKV